MALKRRRSLGKAFPDELLKTTINSTGFSRRKNLGGQSWQEMLIPNFQGEQIGETVSIWRIMTIACILLVVFVGLFIRLFHLQVVQGAQNRELADSNRIQLKIVHAPRGVIYDRNNKILAQNNPGFRVKSQTAGEVKYNYISRDEALALEAKNDSKFNDLEVDSIRDYPYSEATAHVLGYVGEISADELKDNQFKGYKPGDKIGRSGIEQVYERVLRGVDGAEIIEIDSAGKKLRTIRTINPIPGQNVYLSVDVDLQKQLFAQLKAGIAKGNSCCGAAVAEDPKTGQVLALASFPSFDTNAFNDPQRSSEVEGYFTDPNSPLLNRVIAGTYPPGSTFKIATALAGLSTGVINKDTRIEDTGVMYLGTFSFANWYFTEYGRKEGSVDIIKALQRSNDIYFYQVGQRIGEIKLSQVARQIGLGKRLGIDLPGEADGLIPDNSWKQKNIGEVWYPGDTLHMAIGQGYVLTTPLQVLAETAFVADNGRLVQPHLATKITNPDDSTVKQFNFDPVVKDIFKTSDLDLVKTGLALVPKDGGTAWPFFNFPVPTAGKTGTAEFGDPKNKTQAWYTSYAPIDNPQIVLTVLVEKSGEGSTVAGPIAKEIYRWYFSPDKNSLIKDVAPIASASARTLGE